jgi:glucose/arabinose dehydrogenase
MIRPVMIVCAVAALAACKDKGGVGERPSAAPPPVTAGAGTVQPARPGIPEGTDEVVVVPADVVGTVTLVEVIGGLKRPVAAVVAPGDARKRLFVIEQHKGRIVIVENGAKLKTPFLDLGTRKISTGEEQGLLGLAFHPAFATNRKLYINYTDAGDDTRVVEYQVSSGDPDKVDAATARELFTIKQPYSNHNGGHLAFGPDGKLYIGLGDGGAAGDPMEAGQDLNNQLAKMLRLDVDTAGAVPEIAHYGLRNPWRYAFDAKTGDLYIGDVGQDKWENVYVVAASDTARKNFGWNVAEGRHCYRSDSCDRSAFTAPIADYPHAQGCSITGGVVYRGSALPALDGAYFYADYCTNLLRSFRWYADPSAPAGGVAREHWDWRVKLDPDGKLQSISSFGTDAEGELLIVTLTGSVYRLAPKS